MASVSQCCASVGSSFSLGFPMMRAQRLNRWASGVGAYEFRGAKQRLARRGAFYSLGGPVRQRRWRSGIVTCSTLREKQEDEDSYVALELLDAKKKRALYAAKLLIQAPLVGLCGLNVWAHWGDSARASGEPAAGYALALALAGAYTLLNPCVEDLVRLRKANWECTLLRRILPSEEAELPLDWDTDDEESLELHHELATHAALGGGYAEILLALLWAACNCISPPKCEYDVWARHLWLFGVPVEVVRGIVFHMCTCLALEARKWAVNTWLDQADEE